MPETFDRFACGCEHPVDTQTSCECCEYCENCCECMYCECCESPHRSESMCSECDSCSDCCECVFCDSCGGRCNDEFCYECDSCNECCSCERCENCGEDEDSCTCRPGLLGASLAGYSTCPLRKLGWAAKGYNSSPRFGLEIEMSRYSPASQAYTNMLAHALSYRRIISCRTNGYAVAAHDSSISGEDPAECKTVPMTVKDHSVILFGATHYGGSEEEEPSDLVLDECESFAKLPARMQHMLLSSRLRDCPHRWQSHSKSWANSSCGMHINVEDGAVPSYVWLRVISWILRGENMNLKRLGGRMPSGYCHQYPHDHRVYVGDYGEEHEPLQNKHLWNTAGIKRHWVHRDRLRVPQATTPKHAAVSRRHWGGFEFRLFRSSTNPLRILGNCELISVLCHHFASVPLHQADSVPWADFVRTVAQHRHRYPYAAGIIRRQQDEFTTLFNSVTEIA